MLVSVIKEKIMGNLSFLLRSTSSRHSTQQWWTSVLAKASTASDVHRTVCNFAVDTALQCK